MPAWIHGRAEHILAKNPSMPKGEAFAIATQQAHAVGKSPKSYGTLEGRETAKAKYDTPKDDKKTANPGGLKSPKLEKDSGFLETIKNTLTAPIPGTPELLGGAKAGIQQATRFGGRGKGPSEGFKAFQEKRSGIDPVMFHAFADEMRKIAGATITVAPAAVPGPSPTAKQPTRAEAPPLPPLPTGLNVMFAPKPRGAVGNSVPG